VAAWRGGASDRKAYLEDLSCAQAAEGAAHLSARSGRMKEAAAKYFGTRAAGGWRAPRPGLSGV